MKKTLSTSGLLILLLLGFIANAQELEPATPEEVGMSTERLERLTQVMNDYASNGELSGGVTLVARKGKIAYYESFGQNDLEKGNPMGKDAIFRIASQTKAIVSVGIMMLQEEGKLLISDPLGKYIPEWQETTVAKKKKDGSYEVVKAKRAITLRDLLTHTAGIGYGWGPAEKEWREAGIQGWYFADRDEPVLDVIKRMASLPMDAQPGTTFVYGYNTDILGAVIEVVSGMSLDEFLTSRILKPLGMNDTHFYLPKKKKDRLAVVYSSTDQGLKRAPEKAGMESQGQYASGPQKCYSGGAGLLSTAYDYAIFLQMMLNKGEYNGVRILAPKSVELMTMNHLRDIPFPWEDGVGFGLGFKTIEDQGANGVMGDKGEYGWGGAYHSTYWVNPAEDMIVVYFTNLIPATVDDHGKLRVLVYQSVMD
ncbi:serine hydrolase domain-containing protein [Reichenbachiella ulvae]|uniref:Beta-lactamase family protein n=1 Tax=Reichenbachiella ulvae TaxID=2980104 RepID=A0ABT3CU90_9BACT|nr:serine hydrolase domain-containing protein [Reichenbachiella ulvae]MCV9387265.1 beta-lactamase family protein [Reichenbachiella ulvae]